MDGFTLGGIPWSVITGTGGAGSLVFAVWLVITQVVRPIRSGDLIPRDSHERELRGIVTSRDSWKATAQVQQGTIAHLAEAANVATTEGGQTVAKFMQSLQQTVGEDA